MSGPKQMQGRTVGNWILEQPLSEGGMGAVYRARHATLQKHAAVKVMRPEFMDEQTFRERFRREAATQARLEHPNIARVHDYMEQDGCWFLVMEMVEGGNLADELTRQGGPIPTAKALEWIRQTLKGLGYAHSEGVTHRDVKPMNLLLNRHDQVVVADFGIAKEAAQPHLTSTGHTVGTPHYMSPEQVQRPDQVDARSDLYSVGVVLFELLTGRRPFEGDSSFEVTLAHLQSPLPSIVQLNPAVPPAVVKVVERAMEKDPAHRFQNAEEFLTAIERVLTVGLQVAATAPMQRVPPPTTVLSTPPSQTVPMESSSFGPLPPPKQPTSIPKPKSKLWMVVAAAAVLAVAGGAGILPDLGKDQPTIEDVVRHARSAGESANEATLHADLAADFVDKSLDAVGDGKAASGIAEKSQYLAGSLAALNEAKEQLTTAESAEAKALDAAGKARAAALSIGIDLGGVLPDVDKAPSKVPRSGTPEARETARRAVAFADQSARRAQAEIRQVRDAIEAAERQVDELKEAVGDPAAHEREAMERIEAEKRKAEAELQKQRRELEEHAARMQQEAESEKQELLDKLNPGRGRLPDQPVVAVLSSGDPLYLGPFEMELERRLRRSNLDVRDEHNSIELSEKLGRRKPPDATELSGTLRDQGFHVLVLVSLDEGVRKTQVHRGFEGNAVAGRLRINAYLLNTGKPIGRGWSELVEYTDGSAAAKAERSMIGATPELVQAIRADWQNFKVMYADLSK